MSEEDNGVGTLAEFLACLAVRFKKTNRPCSLRILGKAISLPLTYLRFSSSFICSARSKVAGTAAGPGFAGGAGRGVPLDDVAPDPRVLSGEETARVLRRWVDSAVCVTTGERAMLGVAARLAKA